LGSCSSYTVMVSTEGVVFNGRGFVVASGKHTDAIDAAEVRKLASHFVAADFYSMDANYRAAATDPPTYRLSILIDGRTKEVVDYAGSWVGMPAIIEELENETDDRDGYSALCTRAQALFRDLAIARADGSLVSEKPPFHPSHLARTGGCVPVSPAHADPCHPHWDPPP
jgi:hypothetical protein